MTKLKLADLADDTPVKRTIVFLPSSIATSRNTASFLRPKPERIHARTLAVW